MSAHPSKTRSRPWWFRSLALWGLVSYLGGMGWLMTLCTAAMAVVDGEHTVRIESRHRGFFVILGHDRRSLQGGDPASAHAHDWLADVLTSMASDSLSAGGDHVIDLDRDPGLVARPGEASIRDSIARNASGVGVASVPMPAVVPRNVPCRSLAPGIDAGLAPSVRVSRTHTLRC